MGPAGPSSDVDIRSSPLQVASFAVPSQCGERTLLWLSAWIAFRLPNCPSLFSHLLRRSGRWSGPFYLRWR